MLWHHYSDIKVRDIIVDYLKKKFRQRRLIYNDCNMVVTISCLKYIIYIFDFRMLYAVRKKRASKTVYSKNVEVFSSAIGTKTTIVFKKRKIPIFSIFFNEFFQSLQSRLRSIKCLRTVQKDSNCRG